MGIFRKAEKKLEGFVEGGFGRAFKSSVQPVELAHKLAKEMGDHKTVGVSNVYVPNEFDVYLGQADFEQLSAFSDALKAELSNYVTAFARREGWTLVAPPRIDLHRDDDLRVGEFGIATRTVNAPVEAAAPAYVPPAAAAVSPAAGPMMDQTVLYQDPPAAPAAPAPDAAPRAGHARRPSRPAGRAGAARRGHGHRAQPAGATSCWPTPTCRVSTSRSGARATASCCATWGPPTARASTGATSSRPCCSTATASSSALRNCCSRGCRDAGGEVSAGAAASCPRRGRRP